MNIPIIKHISAIIAIIIETILAPLMMKKQACIIQYAKERIINNLFFCNISFIFCDNSGLYTLGCRAGIIRHCGSGGVIVRCLHDRACRIHHNTVVADMVFQVVVVRVRTAALLYVTLFRQ
jgi:hypothetical protein